MGLTSSRALLPRLTPPLPPPPPASPSLPLPLLLSTLLAPGIYRTLESAIWSDFQEPSLEKPCNHQTVPILCELAQSQKYSKHAALRSSSSPGPPHKQTWESGPKPLGCVKEAAVVSPRQGQVHWVGLMTTTAATRAVSILGPLGLIQCRGARGTAAQCLWGEPQTPAERSHLTPDGKQSPRIVQFGHLFRPDALERASFLFPFLPLLSFVFLFSHVTTRWNFSFV